MGSQAPLKPGSVLPKHIHGYGKVSRAGGTIVTVQQTSTSAPREILRCLVAAVGSGITLSGNQTIDGVAVPEGSTTLVIGRTVTAENGIYRTSSSAWTRLYSTDQIVQMLVHVTDGAAYGGGWWGTVNGTTFNLLVNDDDLAAHAASKATASTLGHVKPDGSTIVVDGAGTISTPNGASAQKVRVAVDGDEIGTTPVINFHGGVGSTVQVLDELDDEGYITVQVSNNGVLGSGTAGKIPRWTFDAVLGDSRIDVSGSLGGKVAIPWISGDAAPTLIVGADSSSNGQHAIRAYSGTGVAIFGEVNYGGHAIQGYNGTNGTHGWLGHVSSGVRGQTDATSYVGVHGINPSGPAVLAETSSGVAVKATASSSGTGIVVQVTGSGIGASITTSSGIGISVATSGSVAAGNFFASGNAWATYHSRNYGSPSHAIVGIEEASSSSTMPALEIIMSGTGAAAKFGSRLDLPYRQVTTSTTLAATDTFIGVGTTTVAPTLTLPSAASFARGFLVVIDEAGTAATRNVTITRWGADTINGGTSVTINTNRGAVRLFSNGTAWFTF